jgi:hypothetical protein
MKFNFAGLFTAIITIMSGILAAKFGPGFGDGPFRISQMTYGILISTITSFILTKFSWWGSLVPWLSYLVANGILIFFEFKKQNTVTL